jgi:ubiquinone/menaquinone biosynthesis C-methylase UbiE
MVNSPPDWQLPAGVNRALWDYLHDAAVAQTYDASLSGSSLFLADQRFAERFFHRPGRLVDLGCGTGRLLVPFARRGFWVLGVDLSEAMLKEAAERALKEGVAVQLLKANLVDLASLRGQSFDYAACLFSTLGMITGRDNRRRVVEQVYRLLKPGGRMVLHVHNRWFNAWNPQGRRWLIRNLFQAACGREGSGDRVMPVHQGIAGLRLHLFTRREARRMLVETGFKVLQIQPLGLGPDGLLRRPHLLGWLRAYGYLLAAERG